MKVLALSNLYPPDFVGGYELACAHVVDGLRLRGHDARVLTAAPRNPVTSSPSHVLRRFKLIDEWNPNGMGNQYLSYRLDEAESRLVSAYNIHVLTSTLDEFNPDVVYVCNNVGLGGLGLMTCLEFLRVPWVWQLGDCAPLLLCSTGLNTFRALADEFSRRMQGDFICVSEQLRREIESSGIRLSGRLHMLPYWITGSPSLPRDRYYAGGRLKIMFAGQIARFKGVDVLIEAAARLREDGYDDFSIDLYGNLYDPTLLRLVREHNLVDHVIYKGILPQSELLEIYRDYDVFAFPTLEREPFGMVPIEALARGCVPLISRRCGVAEWVVHGIHCLKTERTPEAFARAFASVMRGEVDLESIARRGSTAAWRDFHLDAILPRIERILANASKRPRNGAGRPEDAYRLARLAEQVTNALIQEAIPA